MTTQSKIMASKMQAILILSLLFTFSSTIESLKESKGGIAIYWGQNNGDGTLAATCDPSNNYEIVILAFLVQFGCNREVKWNFAGHCGDWSPCTKLEQEIKYCQEQGVKVFLSLGGANVAGYDYGLCSTQDAKNVAKYLYDNFLSGQYGPLGSVPLNGIDFDIEKTDLYWDDLARELDALRQPDKKYTKFYLSAAPQCPTKPNIPHLGKAIKTGLFDYIFVQFYNNPGCSYSSSTGTRLVLESWDKWTSLVPSNNTLLVGLPAGPDAAPNGGYIYKAKEVALMLQTY